MKTQRNSYAFSASPFFRLRTKAKLAELLGVSRSALLQTVASKEAAGVYREWETRPKYPNSRHPVLKHKARRIQQPTGDLRELQDRLCELLARIDLPDYLHSARKGRSYRSNAIAHKGPGSAFRIDIKKFYESAQDRYVQRFFLDVMQCSPDVAHILTEVACFRRRLPTGSPLSPLISFLAYAPMFNRLNAIATSVGARMTVYVDDVVFSGISVSGDLIPPCMAIFREFELIGHKVAFFSGAEEKVITGLAVTASGLGITNKRRRKIRALMEERQRATDPAERKLYSNSLIGLLRESSSIEPSFLALARTVEDAG